MDTDSIRTWILFFVLLCCSAFFSATETAFSSLNRVRIKSMAESGNRRAARVLHLSESFDKVLSTILIGNNIVNIAMAALATVWFVSRLGNRGSTVSTVVVTVLVLIFGEISPKSLAKESPERFALAVAPILHGLVILFTPFTLIFSGWKALLNHLFHSRDDRSITEQELLTYVEEAATGGSIDAEESDLIRSAIEFNELEASDIFTPRVDVSGVSVDATQDEIAAEFASTGFSRLPVYRESIDDIIGVLHHKDFYNIVYRHDKPLADVIKPAVFIAPSMKISDLLRRLQTEKAHMAVITDEYGGTAGIVTMEDILEELVGEIWDEHDEIVEEIRKIDDTQYAILCSADFDKLIDQFHLHGETEASSVGGWVMEQLGRIPEIGDTFTYENLFVTVTRIDDRRVLEIQVDVRESDESSETES